VILQEDFFVPLVANATIDIPAWGRVAFAGRRVKTQMAIPDGGLFFTRHYPKATACDSHRRAETKTETCEAHQRRNRFRIGCGFC